MKPISTNASDRWIGRRISFFGKRYSLCADQLLDDSGGTPTQAVANLVRRYLTTRRTVTLPQDDDWCSFRELRGAGPLSVNFANNTHKTIAVTFGDDLPALDRAASNTDGLLEPGQGFDRRYRFYAFPEVPLILNYNAADDLFAAQATLLYRRCAQNLLDIRELLTLGTYLTGRLIHAENLPSPARSMFQD